MKKTIQNYNKFNSTKYIIFILLIFLYTNCTDKVIELNNQDNDFPFEYSRIGKGTPIFLVGGLPGMGSNYLTNISNSLSINDYKIYLINIRNVCHEYTEDYQELTLNKITEDLERLRIEEGIEKINLMGDLFGSTICINYSIKYKENIDKMILSNPIGINSADFEKPLYIQYLNKFEPETKKLYVDILSNKNYIDLPDSLERVKTDSLIILDNLINKTFFNQVNDVFFNENCHSIITENLLDYTLNEVKFDLRDDLKNVKSKVLVIYGKEDTFCKKHSKKITSLCPNIKLVEIPSTKQFTWIENPDAFYLNLYKFLEN